MTDLKEAFLTLRDAARDHADWLEGEMAYAEASKELDKCQEIDAALNVADEIEARLPTDEKWDDDLIQFARLISEVWATCSIIDYGALEDSMDLPRERIDELVDRADAVFEKAKEAL